MEELRIEAKDLNQQGAMLLKTGNYEAAKAKFEKAMEIDPMTVESYKNYGDLCMALENYTEAKKHYKKAILVEKQGLLYFLYGNACFMNDEVHEGLEYYNLAIAEGYDSDEMMFFTGMAYEYLNDDNMALRYYQKAIVKNPSRVDYIVKKVFALLRLGMLDEADKECEHLLETAPEYYDGYHIKTQLLLEKGDVEAAVSFAKSAAEKFPEDPDLCYDYVKCVALNKKYDEAIHLIKSAQKMKYFEDAKRAFIILEAQIHAEMKEIDEAICCCKECIALEDEEFFAGEARFMLMNMNLIKENIAEALAEAEALVKKETEDLYYFAALYYRPFCLKQLGEIDKARLLYKEANSLYRLETLKRPEAIDLYLYRAMCLRDMEEYTKAMEILDFVSELNVGIAEVYVLRAEIYEIEGRKAQAEEELKKAYEIKPELKPKSESAGE